MLLQFLTSSLRCSVELESWSKCFIAVSQPVATPALYRASHNLLPVTAPLSMGSPSHQICKLIGNFHFVHPIDCEAVRLRHILKQRESIL